MIQRSYHHLVADEAPVAELYTALVLKAATRIYKYVFAYLYIFAKVCVNRREQSETFIHLLPDTLRHESANLFGHVTTAISHSR